MGKFLKEKWTMVLVVLVGFLMLAGYTQLNPYWMSNPLKVTDPDNPRFDPDKFQFIDYTNDEDLAAALRKTLPPGTPKKVAERRMTRWNNANMTRHKTRENAYSFCWNPAFSVIRFGACYDGVNVYYSENNEIEQVYFKGKLFPELDRTEGVNNGG